MREFDPASGEEGPRREPQSGDEGGDVASVRFAETRALQRLTELVVASSSAGRVL